MMGNLNRISWALGLGLLWPICCLVFMKLSPGPLAPPKLPQTVRVAGRTLAPPIDTSGSTQFISSGGSAHSVKIFWEEPEPGRVHVIIEVPGE